LAYRLPFVIALAAAPLATAGAGENEPPAGVLIRPPTVKVEGLGARERRNVAEVLAAFLSASLERQCYRTDEKGAVLAADLTVKGRRFPGKADKYDLTFSITLGPAEAKDLAPRSESCRGCGLAESRAPIDAIVDNLVPPEQRARRGRLSFQSTPTDAAVYLDDAPDPAGRTPFDRPVCAGRHRVRLKLEDKTHRLEVTVAPAACEEVAVDFSRGPDGTATHHACGEPAAPVVTAPVPAPSLLAAQKESASHRALLRKLGVGGMALSLPVLVTGIVLAALDGQPTCEPVPPARECPKLYDTAAAGIGITVGGAAMAVAGGVLYYLSTRHPHLAVAPSLLPGGGAALGAAGSF
jgi:hypothetical protein